MTTSIPALKHGQLSEVKNDEAQYSFVSPNQFFNESINLLPAQNAVAPARAFYSNKFFTQSLPIVNGDTPYVQSLKDESTNTSFEDYLGKKTGIVSLDDDDETAEILEVSPDYIKYKNNLGNTKIKDLYNNFIFNRKTGLTNIPVVKKGDILNKADKSILARTNYTDGNGTLNMGKNARIAFGAYQGWTTDDAIAISEDFAKKMRSHHMYQYGEEQEAGVKTGYSHFTSLFPTIYKKDVLEKIDENGIIKVGSVISKDQPLILSSKPRMVSAKDQVLGKLSKFIKNARIDSSVKYDHEDDGIVTDVVKTNNGYKINVSVESPIKIGDKIASRSGNKTTISAIIPQDQMPHTEDGKPIDVLFNHLGLVSRVNASMIQEALLGKIAEQTGKIYKIPTFNKSDQKWYDYVESELEANGVNKEDKIFDPKANRWLEKPITVGNAFFVKLHHTADSKVSTRGQGIYDQNEQPLKGGEEGMGAKRHSGLDNNALLSAGAYDFIKDALHIRGQRNDEYWRQVRAGKTPTLSSKSPFIWDKYLTIMKGTGINAIETPDGKLRASPFTDKQFELLQPVELENGGIVDFKNFKSIEGGLFDTTMSLKDKWGKITLDQPYPNPGFENAIASLLDMKKSDMYKVMSGEDSLGSETGNQAIYNKLSTIDTEKMLAEATSIFKHDKSKAKQQNALKIIQTLRGLKKNNLHPKDLMIKSVPVIPAKFRPYSARGDTFIPGDINELYQDMFNVNSIQKDIKSELGDDEANQNSVNVYNSMKALYGFGTTKNKKLESRGVSGFLNKLVGNTSKFSLFNRAVVSKPVDFSARGVIDVNPELSIDETMLPVSMAYELFAPYIQQRLVRQGIPLESAVKAIAEQSTLARQALDAIRKVKPIVWTRAPVWHKYNTIGSWVKLHDGNNILINPLTTTGAGADFDGDTVNIHVPASKAAEQDVINKLMPSKQVFSIRDSRQIVNLPKQEYILGAYAANKQKAENHFTFNSENEMLEALKQGKIKLSDEFSILK